VAIQFSEPSKRIKQKKRQKQAQVLRLRLSQRTCQAPLRMTDIWICNEYQTAQYVNVLLQGTTSVVPQDG
jgi:hypothetical protein